MASISFLPNLSQRERKIAIWAIALISVLLLYVCAIEPFIAYRASLIDAREHTASDLRSAHSLIDKVPQLTAQWKQYDLQTDGSQVSTQLQHAIQDWQNRAGIELTLQKSDHPIADPKDDRFMQVTFQVQGVGSTAAISRFIYLVEKSKLPARIVRLHIGAHGKEAVDDLTLEMTISSIFLAPPKSTKSAGAATAEVSMAASTPRNWGRESVDWSRQ